MVLHRPFEPAHLVGRAVLVAEAQARVKREREFGKVFGIVLADRRDQPRVFVTVEKAHTFVVLDSVAHSLRRIGRDLLIDPGFAIDEE